MQSESTARTALLSGLIDYAGLFPPKSRDMAGAVAGYRDARALQSWMVDRFTCPDDRLEELAPFLADEPDPWPLSVVISAPTGDWSKGIADYARSLAVVELAMRDVARFSVAEIRIPPHLVDRPTLSAMLASVRASLGALFDTVLFEVSITEDWPRSLPLQMRSIFEASAGAQIRCGGLAIEDFPAPEQVASFIALAAQSEIPFKATAGLHHPIRHWDCAPGVKRHGFLNLAAASVFAQSLALDVAELTEIVAEEDPAAFELTDGSFRWRHQAVTTADIERARTRLMLAYGSCNFTVPVNDLVELGML
ncbi:MAG: hypothetical protein HKN80_04730 [Acidimicrobiia bacterium]|nr:hypothetical protein [Acidimicrobiia bacterium]